MFGSNKFGQLGVGDYKSRRGVVLVTSLVGQRVSRVSCGDRFTVAATQGFKPYSWIIFILYKYVLMFLSLLCQL